MHCIGCEPCCQLPSASLQIYLLLLGRHDRVTPRGFNRGAFFPGCFSLSSSYQSFAPNTLTNPPIHLLHHSLAPSINPINRSININPSLTKYVWLTLCPCVLSRGVSQPMQISQAVFQQVFIPSMLDDVPDFERDILLARRGHQLPVCSCGYG